MAQNRSQAQEVLRIALLLFIYLFIFQKIHSNFYFLFFNVFYLLCYYSCPISPPLFTSTLHNLSHLPSPTCIPAPLSSCPWVVHTSSLDSPLPIVFLTSPCLFCTYCSCFFSFFFKIYLFLDRGEGSEKERERNINAWLPLPCPPPGTQPTTQAHALTRN